MLWIGLFVMFIYIFVTYQKPKKREKNYPYTLMVRAKKTKDKHDRISWTITKIRVGLIIFKNKWGLKQSLIHEAFFY